MVLCILLLPSQAEAKDCTLSPMTLTTNVMDFDTINAVAGGGSGNVIIGSNGNINYGAGYSGPGIGIGGQVTVTGDSGCKVNIYCMSTATLSDGAGNMMNLTNVQFTRSAQNYGGGTPCAGMATPVLTRGNVNKTYYFSGILDGSSGIPGYNPTFATSNIGGVGIIINVDYD